MATNVDIKLVVNEGQSDSSAWLFDNTFATLGVTVAVQVSDDASIGEIALCELGDDDTAISKLFESIEAAKEAYPLTHFKHGKVDSFDGLCQAHPKNEPRSFPDELSSFSRQRFQVASTVELEQQKTKSCRVVAAVEVKNYVPSAGAAAEGSVIFFSNLDAMNSQNVQIRLSSTVDIELAWKPPIVIGYSSKQDLDNNFTRNTNFEMDHGGTYTYTASYGGHESYCHFSLYKAELALSTSSNMYGGYITVSDNKIKCIGRVGDKSSNNQVAAAFWHDSLPSGSVTQKLEGKNGGNSSTYDFTVDLNQFFGSSGCYELENDHVYADNCTESNFLPDASVFVHDHYGGKSELVLKPHFKVDKDKKGEAWIDHETKTVQK